MQETAICDTVIVTEEQEETVDPPHGTIRCIPARRFFTDELREEYGSCYTSALISQRGHICRF